MKKIRAEVTQDTLRSFRISNLEHAIRSWLEVACNGYTAQAQQAKTGGDLVSEEHKHASRPWHEDVTILMRHVRQRQHRLPRK